jgi:hypothetical protein
MSNNQRTRRVSDEEIIARKQSFAKSSFQREEIDNLKARERKILPQVPSSSKSTPSKNSLVPTSSKLREFSQSVQQESYPTCFRRWV